jgi:hypothetical protein
MISDAVLGVVNNENTATVTPWLSPILPSTSPLESQCRDPFRPMAWRNLTSIVCRPQHWQVDSLTLSNKTVKIPLRFCHPMTTPGSSHMSLQKDSGLTRPKLPKGWVYAVVEVQSEVKTEVVDPSQYLTLSNLPMHYKCKHIDQPKDLHPQSQRALNITEALPTSLSKSITTQAVKHQHAISASTSMPLTLL